MTNIECAIGQSGMFTQPPPPTISGDIESLNNKHGDKVDDNKSNNNDDNEILSIKENEEEPNNKENNLIKDCREVE